MSEGALHRARRRAHGQGEFVDQRGFMSATDIRSLAERAGISGRAHVLDLCCGPGGPGRLITRELGCDYVGVDADPAAVAAARERIGDLACRFEVGQVPPVPAGPFDVVLLLETMLAFADKDPLLRGVRTALAEGGRFAFTVEEGGPLTPTEREVMPAADTVWPIPLPDLLALLDRAGLRVVWQEECSEAHRSVVDALLAAFTADEAAIAEQVGPDALEDLLASHRLWSEWLRTARVRKFVVVAERNTRRLPFTLKGRQDMLSMSGSVNQRTSTAFPTMTSAMPSAPRLAES